MLSKRTLNALGYNRIEDFFSTMKSNYSLEEKEELLNAYEKLSKEQLTQLKIWIEVYHPPKNNSQLDFFTYVKKIKMNTYKRYRVRARVKSSDENFIDTTVRAKSYGEAINQALLTKNKTSKNLLIDIQKIN